MLPLRARAYEVAGKINYGCFFLLVVVMENSTLPFPFANAIDVKNQDLFQNIFASFTNGKLLDADLHKIASQLKVTLYDCGQLTGNKLYALNHVSKCNIAPENLEVSSAKITMNTILVQQEINATDCRIKYQSGQWHCVSGDNSSKDATNHGTHYNSSVYRTHLHGYKFFVQFSQYGLDSATGNDASIMFAILPGDYERLLTWPFSKTIQLSVRDQLDPQNTWTIAFAPSEKIPFRRPTREPLPTLINFNFFPHSKMFSKTENFLLDNTFYLEIKFTNLPDPEGATPFSSKPWAFHLTHDAFYITPQSFFYPFNPGELSHYS